MQSIKKSREQEWRCRDNDLIVQDGLGYDWSYITQDEPTEFALMAYTTNSSGSDTELGLESVEKQLVVHQKNEVVYEEKIIVLEFEVKRLWTYLIQHLLGVSTIKHIALCDNGTEFKNREMNEFCGQKGMKREFSVARTPQQNGVAERKNMTLIEAARTMLADSLLPTVFWAEAVNTACYVLNRVLVTKPHNKTPYELIIGRPPSISFMRPFGCPVTILNTLDPLGKFDGKAEEGSLSFPIDVNDFLDDPLMPDLEDTVEV
ncbi:putative ribonuclease H-like domain-containing protein [Tanacetum coccineum]